MKIKTVDNERILYKCATWLENPACEDRGFSNEDAEALARAANIEKISHSICKECAKVMKEGTS